VITRFNASDSIEYQVGEVVLEPKYCASTTRDEIVLASFNIFVVGDIDDKFDFRILLSVYFADKFRPKFGRKGVCESLSALVVYV
jgi:hypothetical protein